jgi:hypothetical protein
MAVFAAGYIIGARAGRERYAQIVDIVETASQRLEEFSSSHPPDGRRGSERIARRPRSQRARA